MKEMLYLFLLSFAAVKAMDLTQAPTSTDLDLSDPKKREMYRNNLLAVLNGQNHPNFKQELIASASTHVSVQTTGDAKVSISIESSNTVTTIKR
jgi:hypothetical protein